MENYELYLYEELLNIPFNLYSLIYEYIELNKNVKIAFVGGYIRDLLIKKIHKLSSINPIDIDIVIEGSAVSLAKYIKKNIREVDICLIKEFDIYNTVELNINNLKLDIASAREEIYEAPGLNPIVKESKIPLDLKRRDISINAIAFEISQRKIYDLFEGINHIKSKKIQLLHKNSIRDDPSRLLRCAKYSSRLDFKITKSSLMQSQQMIKSWPWLHKYEKNRIIFPPAISIRIRMELSEISKYDNLSKIISKLNYWKVLALLNKDIKINHKFIRGLHWIKKLGGKEILYLIKDSKSNEILYERFYINKKDRKILSDYSFIKSKLEKDKEKYKYFSSSNWTAFIEDYNLEPETIKLLISESIVFWRELFRWLFIYRFIKSNKNGKTLKEEGWEEGKNLGDEIKRLRYINIDKYKKH